MNGNAPLPRIGDQAPDFSLPSTGDEVVRLSSFQGTSNVLLAFFPLAFTGVCTSEMCDFSTDVDQFRASDATVFGISVDSIPVLKAFRAQHGITIDLLSDFKRDVSRQYGVLSEEHFFARRAYFIVGKDCRIKWVHVEREIGDKRRNRELLDRLTRLT